MSGRRRTEAATRASAIKRKANADERRERERRRRLDASTHCDRCGALGTTPVRYEETPGLVERLCSQCVERRRP